MPDLDLLQITHHACTDVSSALPGIIFKIPGQDRSPTAQCLEHSQSHSTESTWHTVSQSYKIPNIWCSLFLSLCLSFNVSPSLSLWEKYGCSGIMGTESIGKSPKRAKVYVWACEKERESRLDLFRPGCMCAEHWPSLVLASDVKGSNSIAGF